MPGKGVDQAMDHEGHDRVGKAALEGDGLLQPKVVSPTICSHLVADSRRPKWGDGLVDKDTMAG